MRQGKYSIVALALLLTALFALPVFAQTTPPAPTSPSATATSNQSMNITWTVVPSSSCSGDVDYFVRAWSADNSYEAFTAIDANSHAFNNVATGAYDIEIWTYCYPLYAYSARPAETMVTVSSGQTGTPPAVADNSLGVGQVAISSPSVNGSDQITVTWTSEVGDDKSSTGYCDVTYYYADVTDLSYAYQDSDDMITSGSWTSNALASGNYIVWVTAYSAECNEWSAWAYASVTVP